MMTSRSRVINIIIFTQIVTLLGVLIWLWIRRYSREGVVVTPRVEIDLTPDYASAKARPVQAAQVQTSGEDKPAPARSQTVRQDDLKRLEGIGPKIAATLQEAGISTYKQLARAKGERLKKILVDAGIPLADPASWPEQAALAAAGDWVGLQELKSQLKGGRRTG
jgi:predicted flap endonuclease-1-like 5' DNA nuclease